MANIDGAKPPAPGRTEARTEDRGERFSWRILLAVFLRVVALCLLGVGLLDWAYVLGAVDINGVPYLEQRVPVRNAIGVFAALDLVAAVGLWFASAWGAALWIIVSASRIVLHTAFADVHGATPIASSVEALLIVAYGVLWVLARREARFEEKMKRLRRRQNQNVS